MGCDTCPVWLRRVYNVLYAFSEGAHKCQLVHRHVDSVTLSERSMQTGATRHRSMHTSARPAADTVETSLRQHTPLHPCTQCDPCWWIAARGMTTVALLRPSHAVCFCVRVCVVLASPAVFVAINTGIAVLANARPRDCYAFSRGPMPFEGALHYLKGPYALLRGPFAFWINITTCPSHIPLAAGF